MQLNQSKSNQFYPTPETLARKVRQNVHKTIDWHTRVLDPSAGDGALLALFMRSNQASIGNNSKREAGRNVFAIEIDQDLRYVLNGKGVSVIGTDFLSFYEPQKFDVIVMNPPFNDGDSHVIHAWGLLADEGELVAILNRETIDNVFSKERRLLSSLIEQHGSVERLGQAFSDAKRKTNVETVLVRLQKPKALQQKFQGFNVEGFQQDNISDEDFASDPLAKSDYVKALCDRYKAAETALIARHEAQKQLNFYIEGMGRHCAYYREQEETRNLEALECKIALEDQLAAVKLKFWEELFFRSKLTSKATSDFKSKFMDFAKSQARMTFNYANCLEVLISVLGNQENIFRDAVDHLFKVGCSFDKENAVHWEGWQANDSWKWNKKLIIPYAFSWDKSRGFSSGYGSFASKATDFLDDLDKVLSMISGEPAAISTAGAYRKHMNGLEYPGKGYDVAYSSWVETTFVRFRIYKKGTIHIETLDPSLLAEFNRRAAEGKPWMPPNSSYKQPKYRQKQLVKV